MNLASKVAVVLVAVWGLPGCVTAAPNNSGAQVSSPTPGSRAAAMAGIIATDKQMVAEGLDPPEILKYDAELSEIMPEGEDILAKHDKVRAVAWQNKYNAIMKARYDAVQAFAAKSIAAANAITNTFGGTGRPTTPAPGRSSAPQTAPGFSDWCQSPADATQLVPCNH